MKAEILLPDVITWINNYIEKRNIKTYRIAMALDVVQRSARRRLNYETKITLDEFFLIIDCLAKSSGRSSSSLLLECLEATGKL